MATALTDEPEDPILVCDDEAVSAAEARSSIDDHRPAPWRQTKRAALVNCVIACLVEGNASAVRNAIRSGLFLAPARNFVTTLHTDYRFRRTRPAKSGKDQARESPRGPS
jgi:hypothetical protein